MASERISRPEVTVREMELDDLAPVYHLGERLFTCDLYPFLYRTWDEWEVVGHYNTDPEFSLVAEVDDALAGFIIGTLISKASWTYGYIVWLGRGPGLPVHGRGPQALRQAGGAHGRGGRALSHRRHGPEQRGGAQVLHQERASRTSANTWSVAELEPHRALPGHSGKTRQRTRRNRAPCQKAPPPQNRCGQKSGKTPLRRHRPGPRT
jgi:hypothetical protein